MCHFLNLNKIDKKMRNVRLLMLLDEKGHGSLTDLVRTTDSNIKSDYFESCLHKN